MFSLLWVSKDGLSEAELIEILGISRMSFSGVYTAVQDLLISKSGLLSFCHDDLRKAVEKKYIPDVDLKRKYYLRLADYLENGGTVERRSQELPWCLFHAKSWYRLRNCLCNIDTFLLLCTKSYKFELKRYWNAILEDNNVAVAYMDSLKAYELSSHATKEKLAIATTSIGKFLKEMLQYESAEQLLWQSLQLNKEIHGHSSIPVANIYYYLAQVFWNQGLWDKAEPPCLKSMEIREQLLGSDHLKVAKCLTGMGELWIERNPTKAKPLLERSMEILVKKLGRDHQLVSRLLHDLATVHDSFGEHDQAVQLHLEAIAIREKSLGQNHPQLATSYEILGITYKLQDEYHKAELAFLKALHINELVHGEMYTGVASSLQWLVMVYTDLGRPFEADKYEQRRIKVQTELDKLGIKVGERIVD